MSRLTKVSWTPDLLASFITALASCPDVWDDAAAADPVAFLIVLTSDPRNVFYASESGRTWVWFTDLTPGATAQIHALCRDRECAGRREILHAVLREVMTEYDLHRVQALVPALLKGAVRAASREFVREGVMRRIFLRRGRWIDGVLFSVLRDEVLEAPDERDDVQAAS